MILSPDFSMKDDCCKVENDARIVFKESQIIGFDAPVFAETIDITLIGSVNKTAINKIIDIPYNIGESFIILL